MCRLEAFLAGQEQRHSRPNTTVEPPCESDSGERPRYYREDESFNMEVNVAMAKTTEFVVHLENHPGTLGKCCKALGERGVNILAFNGFSEEGKGGVRLIVDNAATAKTVLDSQRLNYKQNEVAQVSLSNRPGELGRAATQLGEAEININYTYAGIDPKTNSAVVIFGVNDVSKASTILDEVARKAA